MPDSSPFHVGEWLIEPAWNRVSRNGQSVKLEPRVMRLLVTLAASPGRPLLRQELLDTVWPDVLVNEEALSRAISQLRRALEDDPKAPSYIETVHKGGYCLIAPVSNATGEAPVASVPRADRSSVRRLWPFVLALAAAILAALLLYRAPATDPRATALTLVPLTSDPGREIDPAISPDGSRVAYLASTGSGFQLFVRSIQGGGSVRITDDALAKGHPVWSPDGTRIAFVAAKGDAAALYLVPARGGAAVKLIDLLSWSYGLDWSPDGRTIAYSDSAPGETAGIVLLDIRSKAARPIVRDTASAGDVKPVFSPDGRRLAFLRAGPLERQQIAVADVRTGSAAVVLGAPPQDIRGLDWAPGGDALIFSARSGRRFGLHRLAADGKTAPQALAAVGGDLFNPSVSKTGRIVVEEVEQDRDIWRADLGEGPGSPLVRSTADDYDPAFSRQGEQLAFVSERSGNPEIWVQAPRGEARQRTKLAGDDIRQISWSPDGVRLAFLAVRKGAGAIHVVDIQGGEPTSLPGPQRNRIPIGWSAAADTLFLLAPADGDWRLEQFSLASRTARSTYVSRIRLAAVAADGNSIFALPSRENKLLRLVLGQGVVRQFRLPQDITRPVALLPAKEAVYLVSDALDTAVIHRIDLSSGAVRAVTRIDYYGGGISLAPDGRSVAYTRARETANDLAWMQL
jgi:Tol biopolymer transport system component/DNA-binding winged helix-turn-helix (wHTH) protein